MYECTILIINIMYLQSSLVVWHKSSRLSSVCEYVPVVCQSVHEDPS